MSKAVHIRSGSKSDQGARQYDAAPERVVKLQPSERRRILNESWLSHGLMAGAQDPCLDFHLSTDLGTGWFVYKTMCLLAPRYFRECAGVPNGHGICHKILPQAQDGPP